MGQNFDEKDVYRALGMEPPEDQGKPEQPGTEPGAEDQGKEKPTTEHQDQQQEQDQEPGTETEEPPAEEGNPEEDPEGQKREAEEAAEAKRRQELEQARKEAADQARAEAAADFEKREKEFFRRAQLRNQYDPDHPLIENFGQFESWYQTHQAKRMEQQLKAGQLTPEMLESAARRAVEAQKPEQPTEEQVQRQNKERFKQQVQFEVEQIKKIDPKMDSIQAILQSPLKEDFEAAVHDGATFLGAFHIAKRMADYKAKAAAATVAQRNTQGKAHMQSHRGSGAANREKEVPPDVAEVYKLFNPNMTADEMRKDYNKKRT